MLSEVNRFACAPVEIVRVVVSSACNEGAREQESQLHGSSGLSGLKMRMIIGAWFYPIVNSSMHYAKRIVEWIVLAKVGPRIGVLHIGWCSTKSGESSVQVLAISRERLLYIQPHSSKVIIPV